MRVHVNNIDVAFKIKIKHFNFIPTLNLFKKIIITDNGSSFKDL